MSDRPGEREPRGSFDLGEVLPVGWYRLGDVADTPVDQPQSWSGLGADLVWWVDGHGHVVATEAWCPHLGAHLGHLGTIERLTDRQEPALRCGFHGWCFGADGAAINHPEVSRPSVAAHLRVFKTSMQGTEAYAFIDLAWDGRGAELEPWPLAEFGALAAGREPDVVLPSVASLSTHQQVVLEGDFDLNHFRPVHGVEFQPVAHDIGTASPAAASVQYRTAGPRPQVVTVRLDGVSRMWEEVQIGPIRVVLTADYVTEALDRSRVCGTVAVWGPNLRVAERAARRLSATLGKDIGRDAAVWERREYEAPAVFAPSDRLLVEFRRWARRFYPS